MRHEHCVAGGIRTHIPFRARDFKSLVYTIPPPRHMNRGNYTISFSSKSTLAFSGKAIYNHYIPSIQKMAVEKKK